MILKVQSPIPRPDLSSVIDIPIRNSLLLFATRSDVPHLGQDDQLRNTNSSKRERIAERVWRSTVDLSSDDSSTIANGLLEADCSGTTVMGGDVDIEPSQVESRPGVHRNGAQESREEANAGG